MSWWLGNIIPSTNSPTIIEIKIRTSIAEIRRIDSGFFYRSAILNLNTFDKGDSYEVRLHKKSIAIYDWFWVRFNWLHFLPRRY